MKFKILFLIITISISSVGNTRFYYRDTLGNLRINKNYPREINGDLKGNKDSLYTICVNDTSLNINEKLDILDSISPSIQNLINGDTIKQINAVENERHNNGDLKRIVRLISAIIVVLCFIFVLNKRKSKKNNQ